MLKNYFQIGWRNLVKHKGFSIINIAGLAIGMSACFFIFLYVHFEKNFDRFNKNAANIYRVTLTFTGSMANNGTLASNHPAVGPAMKKDFPEVTAYSRFAPVANFFGASNMLYTNSAGQKKLFNQGNIFFVDQAFFTLFSFEVVKGNPFDMTDINSIVIIESVAKKYFGNENPVGKTIYLNRVNPLVVKAVIKDPPQDSHLQFEVLAWLAAAQFQLDEYWTWPEFYTYVQLKQGTDAHQLEKRFPAFIEKYLGAKMKEWNYGTQFHLQPVTDIHLTGGLQKESAATGSESEIRLLGYIGIFVMLIAWINFVNLSTAKSVERAKEVGLRKVIGARKFQLVFQFMTESLIINFLALGLATGITICFFPLFNRLVDRHIGFPYLSGSVFGNGAFWLTCVTLFFTAAFLVGAYPAFVLSRYNPIVVLKGKFFQSSRGIILRKTLVSFQFVLSILLLAGTITVYRQLNYMRDQSPGYSREQIVEVKPPVGFDSTMPARFQSFRSELLRHPDIIEFSASAEIPGKIIDQRNSVRLYEQDATHKFTPDYAEVDDHFFQTFQISVVAGRVFDHQDKTFFKENEFTRVLINEELGKALGFKKPADAVGKRIWFAYRKGDLPAEIIGVVPNYHQRSLKEAYQPILFYFPDNPGWRYCSIRITSRNAARTLVDIEQTYAKIFPTDAFEYFFLDDYFNQQYKTDQQFGNVFIVFTVLAVFVSCLGLLGLTSFVIRQRSKEISIRKVIGASVADVLKLVSANFITLVILAALIALPLAWFFIRRWLENYAFHVHMNWSSLILPPVILLVITMLTIWGLSLKTASENPVKNLRAE